MYRTELDQLALIPLAERSWRLCDRSVARTDAASLIAYVELRENGMYEVVWVSIGFGTARYPTQEAVFRAASRMLKRARRGGAFKPEPIPHRPPAHA
jgi:hypothetical protein